MTEETDDPGAKGSPRPSPLLGAAHVGALWALAIVQPMLSLLGGSPEFFVARDNSPGQIVLYVLVLTFGLPLIVLAVETLLDRFNRNLRWAVHLVLMALVGALLALSIIKRYLDLPAAVLIGMSLLGGAAGALAYDRFRFPRAFMDLLTPAPIVLLVIFFFFSSATNIVLPKGEPEAIDVEVPRPAPVVMVVFDEFPLVTLMKDRNSIDESRFPNFAALAAESDWYPNASAAGAYTPVALPAILTGRNASLERLPIAADYPQSVFTLLGGEYDLNIHELVTQICPRTLCPEGRQNLGYESGTGALFSDLFVVSQHLLLPNSMRDDLPDISKAFGGFGDDAEPEPAELEVEENPLEEQRGERGGVRDLGRLIAGARQTTNEERLSDFAAGLDRGSKARLDFIHMLKPHYPWKHLPDGRRYTNLTNEWSGLLPGDRKWLGSQQVVDIATQRGLLEVGYTDTLLGQIRSALQARGLWDDAMVVVTADHGAGFTAGVERRRSARNNLGWVASVPLFIKSPGQQEAAVIERHACANQILPEIANTLGIAYPWEQAECPPDRVEVLNSPSGLTTAPVSAMKAQRNRQIRRLGRLFGQGSGWDPVYRSGPRKDLIGRPVKSFRRTPERTDLVAIPEQRNAVKQFDPTAPTLRGLLQRGVLRGIDPGRVIAVAVDGRIEAVGWSFDDRLRGRPGYSILLPPSTLEKGFNQVDVYLVEGAGRSLQLLYDGSGPIEVPNGS